MRRRWSCRLQSHGKLALITDIDQSVTASQHVFDPDAKLGAAFGLKSRYLFGSSGMGVKLSDVGFESGQAQHELSCACVLGKHGLDDEKSREHSVIVVAVLLISS